MGDLMSRGGFGIKVQEEEFANEDRSWLKSMKGCDTCRSIQLDASAFAAAHLTDKGAVPSGTVLEKLATGLYGPYTGSAAVNEVQKISESDGTDGGTFKITFDGQETAAIAWDATAAQVQSALEALSNVELDDIVVTREAGLGGAYNFILTFGGQYAGTNVPAVTISNQSLTDGGIQENATVTTETAGVRGAAGLLFSTTKLGDGSGTDLASAEDVGAALFWEGIVDVSKLPTFAGTNNGEIDGQARADLTSIRFED